MVHLKSILLEFSYVYIITFLGSTIDCKENCHRYVYKLSAQTYGEVLTFKCLHWIPFTVIIVWYTYCKDGSLGEQGCPETRELQGFPTAT